MTDLKRKRETGFTLLEVLVAMTLMLIILGATVGTLTDAIHATQAVTLMADTQENLRAGMNYIERDLVQAGEGLPQTGITIPNTGSVSAVNRPGPTGIGTFPTSWTVLPDISPGNQLGLTTAASGVATDMITVIYADNTLIDSNQHWLNEYPINTPGGGTNCSGATPKPNGTISTSGTTTTITFDSTCININTGNTALAVGDLILLQANGGGMALLTVSSANLASNQIVFNSATDPFALNNSGKTSGTIAQLQSPAGSLTYTTTTATRVWMITYYLANSTSSAGNPAVPMLMRQVNMRAAQPVGDVIENMQFYYDVLTAGSSPPVVTPEVANPTVAQLPYVRDAYVLLYARSETPYIVSQQYFRNNLETVVNIRSLNFYNQFQ
jgi:prepilin-type N-terminal cleavage/methylation domain-containing protein